MRSKWIGQKSIGENIYHEILICTFSILALFQSQVATSAGLANDLLAGGEMA